jgi:hypothetical protein
MREDNFQSIEDGMLPRPPRDSPRFTGKQTIVRGHGDAVYRRALLAIEGRVAIVCPIDAYESLRRNIAEGKVEKPTFGFPLEDVYEWSPEANESKWDQATSLAQKYGPERLERYIRGARARRNHPEDY